MAGHLEDELEAQDDGAMGGLPDEQALLAPPPAPPLEPTVPEMELPEPDNAPVELWEEPVDSAQPVLADAEPSPGEVILEAEQDLPEQPPAESEDGGTALAVEPAPLPVVPRIERTPLPIWSVAQDPIWPLADSDSIVVHRGLLRELLLDGTCPLHLRMQVAQALRQDPASAAPSKIEPAADVSGVEVGPDAVPLVEPWHYAASVVELPQDTAPVVEPAVAEFSQEGTVLEDDVDEDDKFKECEGCSRHCELAMLKRGCLALVASFFSLPEVLAVRSSSALGLEWAMERSVAGHDELRKVHSRIKARLWIQRVADLTKDTADETIFETQVRTFANDALRTRMEAEMAEAKQHMERQIHAFQAEVDRRMEEQALRVHAIVEERVQQQLDTILAAEMEKVRTLVEERVQERVRAVVQREVRATVCEVHVRLAALARENDRLREAFMEHSDLCFRSLVWALSPNASGLFARALRMMWCCKVHCERFSAWMFGAPQDRRQELLRARVESLRRATRGNSSSDIPNLAELRALWGPELEDARRLLMPQIALERDEERPPPRASSSCTSSGSLQQSVAERVASAPANFLASASTSVSSTATMGGSGGEPRAVQPHPQAQATLRTDALAAAAPSSPRSPLRSLVPQATAATEGGRSRAQGTEDLNTRVLHPVTAPAFAVAPRSPPHEAAEDEDEQIAQRGSRGLGLVAPSESSSEDEASDEAPPTFIEDEDGSAL